MGRPSNEARTMSSTVLQSWNSFITDNMLTEITKSTNKKIISIRGSYSRPEQAAPTTLDEIRALIGLLYLSGTYKSSHTNIADLWLNDGCGIELCRLVMPEYRFRFLLRMLRFDDGDTRVRRRETDKLAAIRSINDQFVSNCRNNYIPGEFVTVDEMLDAFRGRCSFRQFIKSKPAKYGMKIYAACDARSFYTFNLEVYCGRQPNGPFLCSNTPTSVVQTVGQPFERKWSNHLNGQLLYVLRTRTRRRTKKQLQPAPTGNRS